MTLNRTVSSPRVVTKETKEQKQLRQKNEKDRKQTHQDSTKKLLKQEDEKARLLKLVNVFQEFGIDYLVDGKNSFNRLREIWDKRKVVDMPLSPEASDFLKTNFRAVFIKDSFGEFRIHFVVEDETSIRRENHNISDKFLKKLADESGVGLWNTKEVYKALVELCRKSLRNEKRRFILPELGRFSVRYVAPSEAHEGRNPKTGEKLTIVARSERNRLRFSPSKTLKAWVNENIAVVKPVKHRKDEKKKKRKKRVKSHFDEQKLPAPGRTL